MTRFEDALLAIARFLENAAVPYMVIGGVANLFWGVPRTTLDVDITVWIARSVSVRGQPVRVCTPEDLIVFKIVSDRPRDRDDVAGIIRTQGGRLDRHYLDPLVDGLATELGRPDLVDFYRSCLGERQ